MRPRKPHVEQKPVVEDTPLQRHEHFFLDMTPDELAEYNADPGPEYYEEMERHKRHIVCLHAFGYLVESPVADRQEKWLKFRADQSKATRSKNKLETKAIRRIGIHALIVWRTAQFPMRLFRRRTWPNGIRSTQPGQKTGYN